MTTVKAAIKKAINQHSKKFIATRVWPINEDCEDLAGNITIWIEVSVRRRLRKKK